MERYYWGRMYQAGDDDLQSLCGGLDSHRLHQTEVRAIAYRINIDMNNGKYHTESYRQKQAAKVDRRFGPVMEHDKICEACGVDFVWVGREKTKGFENARYCSRSCSNFRGKGNEWAQLRNTELKRYTTICFAHHEKKCVVCGEDKIVAVHHYNEDHKDDRPENLVPLCPTHHEYIHSSKYKHLIKDTIDNYVRRFGGLV